MKSCVYLIIYSYLDTYNSVKRDASTFYYTDRKISDSSNLAVAEATVNMMIDQVEREVRKKLHLNIDASVYITICDMKVIE
jgi:hypothetical protein